jgi:hypothetical protein
VNAILVQHPAVVKAEIAALARLAHTQSRLSVQYENWAREAEQQGKEAAANRWAAESIRLRNQAWWHLSKAMERKEWRYGRA